MNFREFTVGDGSKCWHEARRKPYRFPGMGVERGHDGSTHKIQECAW